MNAVKKKPLARLRSQRGKDKRPSRTETFLKRQRKPGFSVCSRRRPKFLSRRQILAGNSYLACKTDAYGQYVGLSIGRRLSQLLCAPILTIRQGCDADGEGIPCVAQGLGPRRHSSRRLVSIHRPASWPREDSSHNSGCLF